MARSTKSPATDGTDADDLAALAKALGHPARIGIIKMLFERKSCIGCDIVDEIGLAQSTTSEHLRILKAAGIIIGDIDPPTVCYSLNPARLAPLIGFLQQISNVTLTPPPASQKVRENA